MAGASIGGSLGSSIGGLIGDNNHGWRGGYRGSAIGNIVGTIAGAAGWKRIDGTETRADRGGCVYSPSAGSVQKYKEAAASAAAHFSTEVAQNPFH